MTGTITIVGGTGIGISSSSKTITVSNISGMTLLAGVSFTTSGEYTIPSGAKIIFGHCVGAGAGGGAGGITGETEKGFGGVS